MESEVLQRVKRIETRLMRLAEMMGLDPSNKVRAVYNAKTNSIEIGGMDVSIMNVLDILNKEGISQPVRVVIGGRLLAMLTPGEVYEKYS